MNEQDYIEAACFALKQAGWTGHSHTAGTWWAELVSIQATCPADNVAYWMVRICADKYPDAVLEIK